MRRAGSSVSAGGALAPIATKGAPKLLARCSTNVTPAMVAAVIITSSKKRPAAVTGAPEMKSPTEPTRERPASSTTSPAAMATVGSK
ncbi:hypothetical protein ACVWWN_000438 [Mycobacterium sp. URHB0021]